MADAWLEASADVLAADDSTTARNRLVTHFLEVAEAAQVARVHVDPAGELEWFVGGSRPAPSPSELPSKEALVRHPLSRYYAQTGRRTPAVLAQLLTSGWELEREAREIMERLHLPLHQLAIPLEDTSPSAHYTGWVLVADDPIPAHILEAITGLQGLIRGLDRHIQMLTTLRPPPSDLLTARETMVLQLLARGRTAEAIGRVLGISPRTVHKHQENLYRKLNTGDRLGAVLRGQELGLLRSPAPPSS